MGIYLCQWLHRRFVCIFLILSFATALRAQVDTASIVGTIKDPSGAVIQGAHVTVTNIATGEAQTVTTGSNGSYLFPYLRVGTYSVAAEAPGFKKAATENVALNVQDRKQLDISMQLGTANQEVKVTETEPLIDTQTADVGHVVDAQQVQDLPLNGRRYDQLALLAAGVNPASASFQQRAEGVFSVNGNSSTQNNFVIDGADNNSFTTNLQDQSAQTVQPAVDSLQEFKLQTRDYNVEYGRSAGGVINASLKSGTNAFHGDVYEFLRNADLDANDFFLNRAGVPRFAFQQNQFGATLGGPIRKNTTFFFANWEGTRIRQGQTLVGTVPTPLMRQGNFTEFSSLPSSPSAVVPQFSNCINNGILSAACIDPVAAKIFALYPLPNTNRAQEGVPGGFNGNNYIASTKASRDSDEGGFRIDHKISDSDNIYGHLIIYDLRRYFPGIFTQANPIADGTTDSTLGRNNDRGTNATLAWVHLFNASLFNDAHFTFNRAASHSQQPPIGQNVYSQFGLTGIPVFPGITGGLPEFDVSGFSQMGSPRWLPQNQFAQIWQFKDAVSLVRGSHTLKGGIEWRRDADNFLDLCCNRGFYNFSGQYTGQGVTDFLLGLPANEELENLNVAHIYRNGFNWFVSDTWRAAKRLTINYGVRYEYASPLFERQNHVTNFDPSLNNGQGGLHTVPANASGTFERTTVHPVLDNFAPRAGLALQVTPRLVLRAGAGIYYESYYRYGSESQLALNPPFLTDHAVNNSPSEAPPLLLQNGFPPGFLAPVDVNDIPAVSQLQLRTVNSNIVPSTIYEASLGLQYSFSNNWLVEANYAGNRGRHLWNLTNLNQGNLVTPGSPPVFPFPLFMQGTLPTNVEFLDSNANSTYNALQLTLDKNMSRGLTFHLAYTFSKALSQTSDFEAGLFGIQDRYHLRYGYWDNDTPHRFVGSFTYELPVGKGRQFNPSGIVGGVLGDWQLNAIATYASGQPITIGTPFNSSETGGGQFANCIATAHIHQTIDHWLDPNAYSQPAQFTFGNCSPTPGPRAPGISNWDMSLFKMFPITETKVIQFRAEAFNIWNTPQFGSPNSIINTPSFGQISSLSSPPRQIQFALKFYF
ncbi:MAG: carboxypeptidase regulatory-like domain-containing protein [Bryobacteraceae bacterium]